MTAPDPLHEVIADAIVDADTLSGDLMPAARAVYDAIAATGRLLPAAYGAVVIATTDAAGGFETLEEWGIRSDAGTVFAWLSRVEAETHMRVREQANRPAGVLVRRPVYTGPWEVAQ